MKNLDTNPASIDEEAITEKITQVYKELGGNSELIMDWLQKGNLECVIRHLDDSKDLSSKSIENAFRGLMNKFAIFGDIATGMKRIIEWVEDDPFKSLLPDNHDEEKEVDIRVLEAMDTHCDFIIGNEDILGVIKTL